MGLHVPTADVPLFFVLLVMLYRCGLKTSMQIKSIRLFI
jgi:hypothetical protein